MARHGSTAAPMPTTAHTMQPPLQHAAPSGERVLPFVQCGLRRWRRRRQGLPATNGASPRNPFKSFRRERQFAKPHAGRIIDRVGDRRPHSAPEADSPTPSGGLILPRQHQHVDLGRSGNLMMG